ncbi:hypothetical protein GCM10023075_77120 [Streptosporangium album]
MRAKRSIPDGCPEVLFRAVCHGGRIAERRRTDSEFRNSGRRPGPAGVRRIRRPGDAYGIGSGGERMRAESPAGSWRHPAGARYVIAEVVEQSVAADPGRQVSLT